MRASRHLKPETFPFLAVLLCAMGALILLLLVMDRRAKAVARAKAAQAVALQTQERDAELKKRHAEEEKKQTEARRLRELAAAALREEERQLREQVDAARARAETAGVAVDRAESQLKDLRGRLEVEQRTVTQNEETLKDSRQRVATAATAVQQARDKAKSLATELERLEKQLATLKTKRQRERQTYSLVPYRGKRGDNRKPLYLECGPQGLIFHPDRLTLAGADLSAGRLREEVKARVARLTGGKETSGKEPVYLFFLVRPDGIERYYDTVAVLTGLNVDFGYELVEKDWVLDFSESTDAALPWANSGTASSPAASGATSGSSRGKGNGAPHGIKFGQPEPPSVGAGVGSGESGITRQPALTPGPVLRPGGGGSPRSLSPGVLNPFVEKPGGGKRGEPGGFPPVVDTTLPSGEEKSSGSPTRPKLGQPESAEGGAASAGGGSTIGRPEESPSRPIILGTRELVFRVECKGNEVVLYPGGSRFETSVVGNENGPQALARVLQQMIARRQASIRPGETPYRPVVRFLVRPDGLRSLFLVYPALEPLGVPMTRQDLLDEDELP